jgi:hypothetical protein
MRQIMENLLKLQTFQLQSTSLSLENKSEILKLREKIPGPILGRFDRLVARGKKGVAIVHNGACGECHLRLPSGTAADLRFTHELHVCDNCGRYLYLPADETPGGDKPAPSPKAPVRRGAG